MIGRQLLSRAYLPGLAVILPLLAFFLVGSLLARAGSSLDNSKLEVPYYHVAAHQTLVKSDRYSVNRRYTGVVSARQHTDAGFEVAGKVARVLVDEGDFVRAGAVLAELDTELLNIEKRQLLAQIAEARARLKLSQNSLSRNRALQESGFSSAQRLDELVTDEQSLQASLLRLQAAVSAVESRMKKSVLRAPFEGVITRRFADQGNVMSAGMALLRLQEQGQMEAHVGVPVRLSESLVPGDSLPVLLNHRSHQATVIAVGADVHPQTRTVRVRLALPASTRGINGDLIYLAIEENVEGQGFWLPSDAITDGMRGLWRAYVLVPDQSPEGRDLALFRIEARDINVQYANDSAVFVSGALLAGEQIVSGGLHRFAPGQRVRLTRG